MARSFVKHPSVGICPGFSFRLGHLFESGGHRDGTILTAYQTHCQHDSSLLMLTHRRLLWSSVSAPLPLLYCPLWKEATLQPHPRRGYASLEAEHLRKLLDLSHHFGYNQYCTVLLLKLVLKLCSALATRGSSHWLLCPFNMPLVRFLFF